jgi:hypothetical protein
MDTKKIEEALKSRFIGGYPNARFEVMFDEQNNSLTIRTNLLYKIDKECDRDEDCCMKVVLNKITREVIIMALKGFFSVYQDKKTKQILADGNIIVNIEPIVDTTKEVELG